MHHRVQKPPMEMVHPVIIMHRHLIQSLQIQLDQRQDFALCQDKILSAIQRLCQFVVRVIPTQVKNERTKTIRNNLPITQNVLTINHLDLVDSERMQDTSVNTRSSPLLETNILEQKLHGNSF